VAKNGFKIIDSDMHIMEPPDLWEKYIDKKFRDRAPRGVTSKNVRDLRLVHPDGTEWAHKSTPKNDTSRGKNFEAKQDIFGNDAARGWTSEVQLEAMDIEGIDIAVLYPTRGLRALVDDRLDTPPSPSGAHSVGSEGIGALRLDSPALWWPCPIALGSHNSRGHLYR